MIKFKNITTIWSLFIAALLVVACESSDTEVEKDFEEVNQIEDLLSTADTSNETEPLLTMHFDADLSEEEVKIEFEKAVESYLSSQPSYASKTEGFSAEWYTQLYVYTGTGTDEGTDGTAFTFLWFDTSAGRHYTYVNLDNGRTTERQGGIDAYLIRSSIENTPVETVSITNAYLYLRGTDDWFVTKYNAFIFPWYQTTESTGSSWLTMEPNVWLDADNAVGYDYYHTGRETGYSGNGLEFVGEEGEFISLQVEGEDEVFYLDDVRASYIDIDIIVLDVVGTSVDMGSISFRIDKENINNISSITVDPGYYTDAYSPMPVGAEYTAPIYSNTVFGIPVDFTVIESGEVGEYIDMTYSGEYTDENGDLKTLTGRVRVIREADNT